jgi:uncharacterized protein YkwD
MTAETRRVSKSHPRTSVLPLAALIWTAVALLPAHAGAYAHAAHGGRAAKPAHPSPSRCTPSFARFALVGKRADPCAGVKGARSRHRAARALRHTRPVRPARTPRPARTLRPAAPKPTKAQVRQAELTATIANVLATPCQNTQLQPAPGNLAEVQAAVLCLINQERAQRGEQPLALDPKLQQAAEEHDQEMIAQDYFAHVAPSGLTPVQRIRATGYIASPQLGYVIGENLAWGTLSLATPQAIVAAWIASPGHLANILESQYQQTGIAVVPSVPSSLGGGQTGATYAQEFGVVLD